MPQVIKWSQFLLTFFKSNNFSRTYSFLLILPSMNNTQNWQTQLNLNC